MTVRERIRGVLVRRRWNLSRLAAAMGRTKGGVSQILGKDESEVNPTILHDIAHALGFDDPLSLFPCEVGAPSPTGAESAPVAGNPGQGATSPADSPDDTETGSERGTGGISASDAKSGESAECGR